MSISHLWCVSVDENRKSQSTPIILAEIAKEEGMWVTEFSVHDTAGRPERGISNISVYAAAGL